MSDLVTKKTLKSTHTITFFFSVFGETGFETDLLFHCMIYQHVRMTIILLENTKGVIY